MPNTTELCASLKDLALVAQLSQLVHQVNTTKASTDNENVGLQLFGVVLIVRRRVLIGGANVRPEVNHCVRRSFANW